MNTEKYWDEITAKLDDADVGLYSLLDFYLQVKDLSKNTTELVKQIEPDVIDLIEQTYGEQEFDYKGRTIKVIRKSGMIDFSMVDDVMLLEGRLKLEKEIYKNFLLNFERGRATIKDGEVITDDGEIIPVDKFPKRKPGSSYIRAARQKV